MKSVILSTATRYLMPMLLLLSAFFLLRGHNLPGGGFIGGLVASATFILHCFAFGVQETRKLLRLSPHTITGTGLLIALGSGLVGILSGRPFMAGHWGVVAIGPPEGFHIGTPVFFDIGVYLVVLGAVLSIMLALAEGE
jgi:multicomponent Na+:H+ antiporter subunit B